MSPPTGPVDFVNMRSVSSNGGAAGAGPGYRPLLLWVGRALLLFLVCWAQVGGAEEQFRFPPPEFEGDYKMPYPTTPDARGLVWQYVDVAVLVGALGLASFLVLKQRSRKALVGLSVFSLLYFGFFRQGCVCAIGSIQNVALGLFDSRYAVPFTVLAFFLAPLITALFAGRTFCAGVCPHGALQDLVLWKPVRVPAWLEQGLGVLPYVYLGAGVMFAATGSAFVICRYDPFIPIFRMNGSFGMLLLGGAFIVVGMFVGRPYCRFLCPLGALLRLAGTVSKWRVMISPDDCKKCRMCDDSCPYDAIREPSAMVAVPVVPAGERRRLLAMIALAPVLVVLGGWLGSQLSIPASRLHPTVDLAERYAIHQVKPIEAPPQTAPILSMQRAEMNPKDLLASALKIRDRFGLAGSLFGAWIGLVIGVRLINLSLQRLRTDYEPDRGACVACARCFVTCPREQLRLKTAPGKAPAPALAGKEA